MRNTHRGAAVALWVLLVLSLATGAAAGTDPKVLPEGSARTAVAGTATQAGPVPTPNPQPPPGQTPAAGNQVECTPDTESQLTDCRGVLQVTAYLGLAIDTFAGDDMLHYLNPGDAGKTHERAIGGFDFTYRLFGGPQPAAPTQAAGRRQSPRSLWVYGETVYGVRSADVNCTENPDSPVCATEPQSPPNPGQQVYAILRNASSLEGLVGLRYEFLSLQQSSSHPANIYVKGQVGFLSISGMTGGALGEGHVALGTIITKGDYENSYVEAGFGRSSWFSTSPNRRFKVDAYLERRLTDDRRVSFFAQLLVDTDLGSGSDAIQTFVGFNVDLDKLIKPANTNAPNAGNGGKKGTPN